MPPPALAKPRCSLFSKTHPADVGPDVAGRRRRRADPAPGQARRGRKGAGEGGGREHGRGTGEEGNKRMSISLSQQLELGDPRHSHFSRAQQCPPPTPPPRPAAPHGPRPGAARRQPRAAAPAVAASAPLARPPAGAHRREGALPARPPLPPPPPPPPRPRPRPSPRPPPPGRSSRTGASCWTVWRPVRMASRPWRPCGQPGSAAAAPRRARPLLVVVMKRASQLPSPQPAHPPRPGTSRTRPCRRRCRCRLPRTRARTRRDGKPWPPGGATLPSPAARRRPGGRGG